MLQPRAGAAAPLVAEALELPVEIRVLRDEHAAFARGDLLVGVEGKRAHVTDRADVTSAPLGAEGFAGVFDDPQVVSARDVHDGVHVRGPPEDVHRQDGPRPGCDPALDRRRIEVERHRVDVHEHRDRVDEQGAIGRRDEAERRRDDLVARPKVERLHREVQRGRSAAHRGREARAGVVAERALELPDLGTEAEKRRAEHADHRLDIGLGDVRTAQRDLERIVRRGLGLSGSGDGHRR